MLSIVHFYVLVTSTLLCTILVPFVAQLSVRIGGVDKPGERKIHHRATPRLGGIAVFCSLLFTIIFFSEIDQKLKGFLAGAIVIFLTGLADDLTGLSPRQKFAGEFLAAGMVIFMGDICVRHLGNPLGIGTIELGPLAVPFTFLGIVGLINAINLLDGLDGLAAGVCTICCVTFAIISFISGNTTLMFLCVALTGSLLGFLRYNHHPAIIFMGDSGSLLLGYCMGVFSVMLASGGGSTVSPYIPLLALGVPILDTVIVMANRKRAGKPLFLPDNTHLHHRLMGLGLGHRATVLTVFGLTYLFNLFAIFGNKLHDSTLLILFLLCSFGVYGVLRYMTQSELLGRVLSLSDSSRQVRERLKTLVHRTGLLSRGIKYLILAVLLLPVCISHNDIHALTLFPVAVLIVTVAAFFSSYTWHNLLLQSCLYASGGYLVFILENYGRDEYLFNVPLHYYSHAIFLIILLVVGMKVLVRKRLSRLIVSPFEYLIMLIVLTVPLLPPAFTGQYHLLTVAAKSVILFVGFKLVLMRQIRRNRKIILTLAISSFVLLLRSLLEI